MIWLHFVEILLSLMNFSVGVNCSAVMKTVIT